jgi:methyl acetate hydrolase
VESVSGQTLGQYFQQHIFAPLGLNSTSFNNSEETLPRTAFIHHRAQDGNLTESKFLVPKVETPELHLGGGGLYSTASDISKLLQALLNDGVGPQGQQILKKESVDLLFSDQTTPLGISLQNVHLGQALPGIIVPGMLPPSPLVLYPSLPLPSHLIALASS